MAGLADIFSGGQDSAAADVIQAQLDKLNAVGTPSAASLTLPQLQKFVSAGIMTPEEAQTYLQGSSAFSNLTADNSGMDTELASIGKLQDIINSGGEDAEEQANVQKILNTLGTTEAGDNAAVVADNARRGVGNSGLTMAARLSANQNDATNANENALNEAADAEARDIAATEAAGTLGGQVQGQQYTAGANKASAADAIAKFNAQQQQQEENLNVGAANTAKAANLANAQDISNKDTVSSQTQEESIPAAQQKAYEDALSKATAGMSGADALAATKQQTGQQNAGILGGLLGTAGTVGAAYLTGNPYAALASTLAANKVVPNTNTNTSTAGGVSTAATGGEIMPHGIRTPGQSPMNMKSGGPVPGEPMVSGDSPMNDTQLAKLSPHEVVLPVTKAEPAMRGDLKPAMDFLRGLSKPESRPSIHPKAVLDTLRGLSMHHAGAA